MNLFETSWRRNDKFSTRLLKNAHAGKLDGKLARKLGRKLALWPWVIGNLALPWPWVAMTGHGWPCWAMSGHEWPCPACPAMAGHDHSKPAMASHGQLWLPTAAEPMGPKDPTPSKTKRPNTVQDPRTPDSGTGWIELENATG